MNDKFGCINIIPFMVMSTLLCVLSVCNTEYNIQVVILVCLIHFSLSFR